MVVTTSVITAPPWAAAVALALASAAACAEASALCVALLLICCRLSTVCCSRPAACSVRADKSALPCSISALATSICATDCFTEATTAPMRSNACLRAAPLAVLTGTADTSRFSRSLRLTDATRAASSSPSRAARAMPRASITSSAVCTTT